MKKDADKIFKLLEKYINDHPLAEKYGSEYITQSDSARDDALYLVCDIFDSMLEEED